MLNIAPDIRPVGLRYPSSLYNSSLERIIGALAIMRYTYALLTSLRTKCHAVERFDFSRNFPEYIWLWWMKYKSKHRAYCYQRSSFFSVSVSPTWRDESSAYAASVRRIINGSIHSSNPALLVRCKRVSTTRQSTRVNRHWFVHLQWRSADGEQHQQAKPLNRPGFTWTV